jgi:hypothetical protein
MVFATAIVGRDVMGAKAVSWGTFACTGVTGGDIKTGLHLCQMILLQPNNTASPTEQCDVNKTLPYDGSAITIVTTTGVCGYWLAWGDNFT